MASATAIPSSSSNKGVRIIRFDPGYIKTVPGILKVSEVLTSLVGFICIQTITFATYLSAGGWYSFVSMTGFWIPLLLFLAYIFHLVERLHWLPWLIVEFGFAAMWSIFFFIAAAVAASKGKLDAGWGAGAFFGFMAVCIFGYEAVLKYKAWRRGDQPQGEAQSAPSNVESNTATGPSYPTY